MVRAGRSLIEPEGLALSSFRNSRHGPVSMRLTSIRGVEPMRSRTEAIGLTLWPYPVQGEKFRQECDLLQCSRIDFRLWTTMFRANGSTVTFDRLSPAYARHRFVVRRG